MSDAFVQGNNCSVTLGPQGVEKVSRQVFVHEADAADYVNEVREYAGLLATEPLSTARLVETGVRSLACGGFAATHTVEYISGPSLAEIPEVDLPLAIGAIIREVGAMSTLGSENVLRVPIDAGLANFSMDPGGEHRLIDLYPPLTRHADGSFPIERFSHGRPLLAGERLMPHTLGTKSGVIIGLLAGAVLRGEQKRLSHALANDAPSWCSKVLPDALDSSVRSRVQRAIAMRFIPQIALTRIAGELSGLQERMGNLR